MSDAKTSKIPLDTGYFKNQMTDDELLDDNEIYRKAIGSLLYLSGNTRPDIAAAVSILSRKVSCPTQRDWNEVKRILRYLKGTLQLQLCVGCNKNSKLVGYADADWASDVKGRKSTSGYLFKFGEAINSYASKKQGLIALSSNEAELVDLAEATQELIWLRTLFEDLQVDLDDVTIYEDNQSCLKLLDSEKINPRTKHIDVKYYFLRDIKESKEVKFIYCPTEEMVADILTKPLQNIK
ncbi:uncharacterized protein LOC129952370 [Eupeodes corollae]|uniref:uncharacterized protein LOC129952370 n=1 Tax=Eupeodes corollae TaxID=290404 RepID=UPI002493BEED|nr:uncharacterized protein LOC129952370 [Eupeodes corollae]